MLLNLSWAVEVCGGVWSVAQLQRKGHAIGLGAGPGEVGGAAAINCLIMPSLFQYSTGTGWGEELSFLQLRRSSQADVVDTV